MVLKFEDRTYAVEFFVRDLPKPTRFFNLMYIWDVSSPSESDGDELALKQEMTFKGNRYIWTIPKDDHLSMHRTGVIAF